MGSPYDIDPMDPNMKKGLLEEILRCDDPLQFLTNFQEANGIEMDSLAPMLPMLDLQGIPRIELHTSLIEMLKDKLVQRIEYLGRKDPNSVKEKQQNETKLKKLLNKYFPMVRNVSLQPVLMSIMKNISSVDDQYLKIITSDIGLYSRCDVTVKRQIWTMDSSLFAQEMSPILIDYVKEKVSIINNYEDVFTHFYGQTSKQRRNSKIVSKLVEMIGSSVTLYEMATQIFRTFFTRTNDRTYCSLRVELLMALHDKDVSDVTRMDDCHKFIWCLDACFKENLVDTKRARELMSFIDSKHKNNSVIFDVGMVLSDFYAVHFLATNCMRFMERLIERKEMARQSSLLHICLRLLNLGLNAYEMFHQGSDSRGYDEPYFNVDIVIKFCPAIMSLMVDDQVRFVHSKISHCDERESALMTIDHGGLPPEAISTLCLEDNLAAVLVIYYTFAASKKKDKVALKRIIGCLANTHKMKAYQPEYLHHFVSFLIIMRKDFADDDFASCIIDQFFLPGIEGKMVSHHLLKLLYHVMKWLSPDKVDNILSVVNKFNFDEPTLTLLKQVEEKVREMRSNPEISTELKEDNLPIQVPCTPMHPGFS